MEPYTEALRIRLTLTPFLGCVLTHLGFNTDTVKDSSFESSDPTHHLLELVFSRTPFLFLWCLISHSASQDEPHTVHWF